MKFKHIFWDWNGTLLNDVWLCVEVAASMLQNHREHTLSMEEYREVFGFPIIDYYKQVGFDFEKESFETLAVKFISEYNQRVRECGLHENVKEVLSQFQEKEFAQFILSAAHKEDLVEVVKHHQIKPYFQDIEGLHNHKAESKVHLGHQLIKRHGLNPEEVILVGDTLHDYEVATEIGVECMLVGKGHQSALRMARVVGRDKVSESLDEVRERLL